MCLHFFCFITMKQCIYILLYLISCFGCNQKQIHFKPHIIIIQPDEHRGSVMSIASDPLVKTPNLDKLASQGICYKNTYSVKPVCSTFRRTIQTGLYRYQHGVHTNDTRMDTSYVTIAKMFRNTGYTRRCNQLKNSYTTHHV